MGLYAAGQVVFLRFPFSDLSRSKLRPVVLLAYTGQSEWLSCQITSNPYIDSLAIALLASSFVSGGLRHDSYVRPGKLFTAHESIITADVGLVTLDTLRKVQDRIVGIVRQQRP